MDETRRIIGRVLRAPCASATRPASLRPMAASRGSASPELGLLAQLVLLPSVRNPNKASGHMGMQAVSCYLSSATISLLGASLFLGARPPNLRCSPVTPGRTSMVVTTDTTRSTTPRA